jgi:hypothetical protein
MGEECAAQLITTVYWDGVRALRLDLHHVTGEKYLFSLLGHAISSHPVHTHAQLHISTT